MISVPVLNIITKHEADIVVWFSCGAPSAVALKKTVEIYGKDRVRAVYNPVAEEHPDNLRFCKDVEEWVGIEVEIAKNPKFNNASAREVWEAVSAMAFPHGAPCTKFLKRHARQFWESNNPHIKWHVFGFTLEEKKRHQNFVLTERDNALPVLIDLKITRHDCALILRKAGLRLPVVYELGMPNANCLGCVKATSPTYWNLVRRLFPNVFRDRAEQSRRLGVRLVRVKGKRIFLDELDPTIRGNRIKKMPDCGIHCEEKLT